MSECHCRVQNERAVAWTAAGTATTSHVADWKQAHKVLCALDQTSTCTVPSCPAVTQPAAANGVDAEDCSEEAPSEECVPRYIAHSGLCSTHFNAMSTSATDNGAECKAHCNNEDGYAHTVHGQPNCRCCSAPAKRLGAGGWNYWMGTC